MKRAYVELRSGRVSAPALLATPSRAYPPTLGLVLAVLAFVFGAGAAGTTVVVIRAVAAQVEFESKN